MLVSVHGGHSGGFCSHADDSLEAIVEQYIQLGFQWVCLTEHMPSDNLPLMAPEEAEQGYSVAQLQSRFAEYFSEARRLQALHKDRIELLVGFETDAYTGYESAVANLITTHEPEMIVGSVHHVNDVLFDASPSEYRRAVKRAGSIDQLYCDYFDRQLELINLFEPAVVGHFDLIRIYDADYLKRWQVASIRDRALRNLKRIKELDLILDLNLCALTKGASEPYLSEPLMRFAIAEGIAIAPGDDAHGVSGVGVGMAQGVSIFESRGGVARWTKPRRYRKIA